MLVIDYKEKPATISKEDMIIPIIQERQCGECTACCQGYVTGSAHGHEFFRGKPCFFLGDNCTIYADRPVNPCQNFQCTWLKDNTLPVWMRPDRSGVLVVHENKKGIEYYNAIETDKPMAANVLNWLIQFAIINQCNLQYMVNGGINRIGTQQFMEMEMPLAG